MKPILESRLIGRSVEGRPILLHRFGGRPARPGGTLLIGGIHGNEQATTAQLERWLQTILTHPEQAPEHVSLIPLANPDGAARATRYNAHGVDLNRNFPTGWSPQSEEPPGPAPLSEPESRHLQALITTTRPGRIVSLHWALAELEADGPHSAPLARAMWAALSPAQQAPYRLRLWDAAAPVCPGSFGQWSAFGLSYPDGSRPEVVTLELPYDPRLPRPDELPEDHLETVRAHWAERPGDYLDAAWPAVAGMLGAACQP